MNIELTKHSRTVRAFLAGTHHWFERQLVGEEKSIQPGHGVQAWGLAALDLAREHSFAILTLLDPFRPRMFGAAAALQRPLLESMLRGYVFSFCEISDAEVRKFQDAQNSYPIETMISRISVKQPRVAAYLSTHYPIIRNALHRYAHGDAHQLSRRLTQASEDAASGFTNIIQPRNDERDVIGVLLLTARLTIFSMLAILDQLGDVEGCKEIGHRLDELDHLFDAAGNIFSEYPENATQDLTR